ncbi:hypothetical protein [Streptomyces clavuligerus]|uniref:hypothetical protein n=1 Tax=Streptomyces clavuligerus TaxID=1901 RepID=UPI0012FE80F1|nr:hypothetical protein [Streptomyces clavuligerus]WDN56099.1 hypothetical protein LL058_29985 [Streptomyces clavuligerus]
MDDRFGRRMPRMMPAWSRGPVAVVVLTLAATGPLPASAAVAVSSCTVNGIPVDADEIRGTSGNDVILCPAGLERGDRIEAGAGNDRIEIGGTGVAEYAVVAGQEGDDVVVVTGAHGSAGSPDGVTANRGLVYTGSGQDTIQLTGGNAYPEDRRYPGTGGAGNSGRVSDGEDVSITGGTSTSTTVQAGPGNTGTIEYCVTVTVSGGAGETPVSQGGLALRGNPGGDANQGDITATGTVTLTGGTGGRAGSPYGSGGDGGSANTGTVRAGTAILTGGQGANASENGLGTRGGAANTAAGSVTAAVVTATGGRGGDGRLRAGNGGDGNKGTITAADRVSVTGGAGGPATYSDGQGSGAVGNTGTIITTGPAPVTRIRGGDGGLRDAFTAQGHPGIGNGTTGSVDGGPGDDSITAAAGIGTPASYGRLANEGGINGGGGINTCTFDGGNQGTVVNCTIT